MDDIAHLSFGDVSGAEYTCQLFADALIHRWDLARSIGADERLEPDLVEACADWFAGNEDLYRVGRRHRAPRPAIDTAGGSADPAAGGVRQGRLTRRTRSASSAGSTEAFNRHDVDAVMALMTEDCVFEDTSPAERPPP